MKTQHKQLKFPAVAEKFQKMPTTFVNNTRGWSFTKLEVETAAKEKKLLQLDIDMAGKGTCSLKCGHCFRRLSEFHKEKRMALPELLGHLAEAKKLGLQSVKIIGPGEPLEERGFLHFLESLNEMGITSLIFTKGHVLGNDELAMKLHGMDGRQLTARLKELGVSILLGTTSFDAETEDATVGNKGYHAARDVAIVRLAEAGFNDFIPDQPTRLAFICTPVTPANIDEVFELYTWARLRNIQFVMAPTMVAGKALDKMCELLPSEQQLLDFYVKVNIWAIMHGVLTLAELQQDGVSAYAGGAVCNQVACGMFLRGDGKMLRCPGDDISIQGDLTKQSISEIWLNSENLTKHAGHYNNGCPPKEGKVFPDGFFEKVLKLVEDYFTK